MISERTIPEKEYKNFLREFKKALKAGHLKKKLLDECYELLEVNLVLLGSTAIEDCLQDDLSMIFIFNTEPTLRSFREIGINVWMLTGDHPFTAVSIGQSCGLIDKTYTVVMITSPVIQDVDNKLHEILNIEKNKKVCMVLTGDVVSLVLSPNNLKLYELFKICVKRISCAICSRVTPKQKAELVLLIKNMEKNKTTLAIGDGANDVNMITSADVGIGIMGNEGQQAARASDYVIGQFSYLRRLMFVHGREAYRKNSFAVGYILWKNFLYVMPILL